jgi:hypothetical protein
MIRSLTLLLPHELASVQRRLPALETLLARGDRSCDWPRGWQQRLLRACGLNLASQEELPLGPLCALGDGLAADDGFWLCAEPVHLVADQDKVYLAARAESLAVTAEEAAALADEFNALYRDDGWQLYVPAPTRWYLRLPQAWQLHAALPDDVLGCDVRPLLPQGADGLRLVAALNEIQMLFHGSVVNAQRQRAGLPAINSLWLWGGAIMPEVTVPWQRMQGDDCLLRGLAERTGIRGAATADAADWLQVEGSGVVLFDAHRDDLVQLEQSWFMPLLQALRRGQLHQLELHLTQTSCRFYLQPRRAWHWWHLRRPLATWA